MSNINHCKTFLALLAAAFIVQGATAAAWIEPNVGQSSDEYDYVVRAKGLTALVAGQHVDFLVASSHASKTSYDKKAHDKHAHANAAPESLPDRLARHALRLQLINASDETTASPGNALKAVSNYFTGSQASQWTTGVPHIDHARINGVYPGIDVVYRLNNERLEYDFEVASGADAGQIQLRLLGAQNMSIADSGEWVATTPAGVLRQLAPVVFQAVDGQRKAVAGKFAMNSNGVVGFELDKHDEKHALVIDPVIEFSGYVGGSSGDNGYQLRETSAGNFILMGSTASVDLTGTTPGQLQGNRDVFVMELDPATGNPNWVTILGGTEDDYAENMELDSLGNIVIVGYSASNDYPTLNAFQPNYVGTENPLSPFNPWDGTITKLGANGASLIFSTYFGGADADFDVSGYLGFELFRGLAIDGNDDIYIVGQTSAADFPVTTTIAGRACMEADINAIANFTSDIVLAKFTGAGARLMSACIGGTERDGGRQVVLGPNDSVYIAGFGRSGDLPGTSGFFQPLPAAELTYSPFVIKMNADLTAIEFATYVGEGLLQEVVIDAAGNIFGVSTAFTDLSPATPGAFQTDFMGDPVTGNTADAFAFKLNADGTSLAYGTYLGGTANEDTSAVELDSQGRLFVGGTTSSADFPLKNPISDTIGPLLAGSTPLVSISMINNLRLGFTEFGSFGYSSFIARNGINQTAFSEQPGLIGLLTDLGTSNHDSSDVLLHDIDGNFFNDELIVTNKDAANEYYRWSTITQAFELLGTTGLATTDSRGAAKLFPSGTDPSVAVANYGESNQLVGLVNGSTFDPISVDFGRVDGNTTAIASGTIGPGISGFAIVVANENQDVRLYPFDGGSTVGPELILSNSPGSVSALDIGDVNGDGQNDLITASLDGPVEVFLFDAGLPNLTFTLPETSIGNNTAVLLVDVDFDGDQDLLVGRTINDLVFENTGGGTFVLQSSFTVDEKVTAALTTRDDATSGSEIYIVTEEGIDLTTSGRPTGTLSVLNSSGTELEFSTLLSSGGATNLFRGLDFAAGSESKVLLAAGTSGDNWPKVNSSNDNAGEFDAVYMVLELDQDGDAVLDGIDNCLLVANPDQRDSNMDGFGNICDPDLNNDGTVNFLDISLFAGLFLSSDEDADLNGDGTVSFLDLVILRDYFLQPPGPGTAQAAP